MTWQWSRRRAHCHLTLANLPARAFFLFFLLPFGFFLSPLHPTSRIDILDHENFDLIRRSSRARYPRFPPSFFRIDSVCISRIFERNNRYHLGFHCIHQYMYYTTVGWCQGVKKLANLGACSYVMGSLLCIKWETLGLWFNVNCYEFIVLIYVC